MTSSDLETNFFVKLTSERSISEFLTFYRHFDIKLVDFTLNLKFDLNWPFIWNSTLIARLFEIDPKLNIVFEKCSEEKTGSKMFGGQ